MKEKKLNLLDYEGVLLTWIVATLNTLAALDEVEIRHALLKRILEGMQELVSYGEYSTSDELWTSNRAVKLLAIM